MSATAIQPGDETTPVVERRRWLLFDPLLVLAALGLIACSLVTLKGATKTSVPGSPLYYVERQAIFAGVGLLVALVISIFPGNSSGPKGRRAGSLQNRAIVIIPRADPPGCNARGQTSSSMESTPR